ncbi:hypothetical protein ACIRP3_36750 [Streptomyces sp. NPDC101209]|uniref:hypothetical protein n=1 Tax=Streptomyces sp. NPDC101209 TaxID=3366129 RepID=UPI003809F0B9
MTAPALPILTPDSADFQAVMDTAFDQVAFIDPDGMELPGDVLYAFRDSLRDRYFVPNKSTRAYLRARGIREQRIPALARRRFYVGLLLRQPYEP